MNFISHILTFIKHDAERAPKNKVDEPAKVQLANQYKNRGYSNIPNLPNENESQRIVAESNSFPSIIVVKSYMDLLTFSDDIKLLRGEFLALWWLSTRKKVASPPQYFLYRYGINFDKTKIKLRNLGLLDSNDKATQQGSNIIEKNPQLILEHRSFIGVDENGEPQYHFTKKANGKLIPVPKIQPPINPNKKSMDDYFYHSQDRISYLWQNKNFSILEDEATEQIDQGNWYPSIFRILAMLYRKQKRYAEEVRILKLGIRAQELAHNPGVAKRDFEKRLIRATELMNNN